MHCHVTSQPVQWGGSSKGPSQRPPSALPQTYPTPPPRRVDPSTDLQVPVHDAVQVTVVYTFQDLLYAVTAETQGWGKGAVL